MDGDEIPLYVTEYGLDDLDEIRTEPDGVLDQDDQHMDDAQDSGLILGPIEAVTPLSGYPFSLVVCMWRHPLPLSVILLLRFGHSRYNALNCAPRL